MAKVIVTLETDTPGATVTYPMIQPGQKEDDVIAVLIKNNFPKGIVMDLAVVEALQYNGNQLEITRQKLVAQKKLLDDALAKG